MGPTSLVNIVLFSGELGIMHLLPSASILLLLLFHYIFFSLLFDTDHRLQGFGAQEKFFSMDLTSIVFLLHPTDYKKCQANVLLRFII